MPQYTVQAPDGRMITLQGPAGASQEEVIKQAQILYQQQAAFPKQDASSPPSQSSGKGQSVIDYSRALNNGLSFGFADNVEAALNTLPVIGNKKPNESYGDAYSRNLAQIRGEMEKFQQQSPVASTALDMAGGLAAGALTGGVGSAATPSLLARMGRGAATGMAYGALGQAGNSNADTTPELLKAAATGGAVGAAGGAAVPMLMEGLNRFARNGMAYATKISPSDRMYGKTPEEAALKYTKGVSPEKIKQTATASIDALSAQNQALARGVPGDISKAQNYLTSKANEALRRQDTTLAKELQDMADFLNVPVPQYGGSIGLGVSGVAQQSGANAIPGVGGSGQIYMMGKRVINGIQDGEDIVNIKQDFSNAFVNWKKAKGVSDKANEVAKKAYRYLDQSVDNLSPEIAKNNQIISSLIPVKEGADMVSRQAGIGQNMWQRATAMTGASALGAGGLSMLLGASAPTAIAAAALPAILADPRMAATLSRGMYAAGQSSPLQQLATYVLSQSSRPFYQK